MFDKALERTKLLRDEDRLIEEFPNEEKLIKQRHYSTFPSPFEYSVTCDDLPCDTDNRYDNRAFKKPCALCENVANQLTLVVTKGTRDLDFKVKFPASVAYRIAEDIVLMSQYEPCGFNGCQVNISLLTDQTTPIAVGIIPQSKGFVCTFHLDLQLRLARSRITEFAYLCCSRKVTKSVHEKNYVLSKRKLYFNQETENFTGQDKK